MAAPGASAENFRDNIQAMVRESVGKKLIHEGLDTFDKERDEALRHIPTSANPIVWFTEQNQLYNAKCQEYLENVRPELHHAIDALIDSLEEEFVTGSHGPKEDALFRTPQTLRSASNGIPIRLGQGQVGVFGPSQPRAPEAAMDALIGGVSSPTRSATLLAEDSRPAANRAVPADLFVNTDVDGHGRESGSPVASPPELAPPRAGADILPSVPDDAASASKRHPGDEAILEGRNKRPRLLPPNNQDDVSSADSWNPKLKPILMDQVKPDECVFQYRHLPGLYVLRCNRNECKARYRTNGPFYFRAHPFQRNRAMKHFGGEGHSIRKEEAIFKSYAREVSDATEQCNVYTSKARQPHTPKTPTSELPGPSDMTFSRPAAGAPLTPASPSTSRNKGKQPASFAGMDFGDDDDSSFDEEDAEILQSSGSTVAEELARSQPYPTRSRVSIPDDNPMQIDSDSDEDAEEININVECPSLGKWPRSARRFAPL
ncbi:hypothetical protein PG997_012257 [Apiospora hydei]|uniref:Uncharacterized protein n=1 Tax=Apiospora hydei TaxID=1337664 RepID=A0ABR1V5H0_9PEZI